MQEGVGEGRGGYGTRAALHIFTNTMFNLTIANPRILKHFYPHDYSILFSTLFLIFERILRGLQWPAKNGSLLGARNSHIVVDSSIIELEIIHWRKLYFHSLWCPSQVSP